MLRPTRDERGAALVSQNGRRRVAVQRGVLQHEGVDQVRLVLDQLGAVDQVLGAHFGSATRLLLHDALQLRRLGARRHHERGLVQVCSK